MIGNDLPSNTQLGRYRLTGRLGQGGMGTVYSAEDLSLQRVVAVKILGDSGPRTAKELERFLLEARAAARLNHPNVVTVHDVGQREGMAYIVMELVPGGSAQTRLRAQGPFSWPEATRIILEVCRGLAAAHAAGLIHRDIKPGNILLGADGTAKLADFGLAKAPTLAPARLTRVGDVLGTPQYMSPEQCAGEELDERADLYALGATYYALLAGRPPFDAEDTMQVLYAQCAAPVPDPRAAVPTLPAGCRDVLTRALAKQRRERFRTAHEMAAALESLLSLGTAAVSPGKPLPQSLRPEAAAGTASRAVSVPLPRTLGSEDLTAAAVNSAGASSRSLAPPRASTLRRSFVFIALGLVALGSAFFLLGGLFGTSPQTPDANPPARLGKAGGRLMFRLRPNPIRAHPGGAKAVSAGGDLLASGGVDGTACIWSADGSRLLHTCKHEDWKPAEDKQLNAVALSPDGNLLACGGKAKKVFLWDARSGKALGHLDKLNATICALAFAPSGKQLAVATQAELVLFERVGSKFSLKARLLEGQYVVAAVAYSGDGKRLAACTYQQSVCTWDVATLTRTQAPGKQSDWLEAVALSADGSRIVFGGRDGDFFLWEPPQPPRRLGKNVPCATTMAFVPGRDAFLLTGGWDSPLQLCDLAAGGKIQSFAGPPQDNRSLCFAPSGKLLASASSDGSVYLWDVQGVPGVEN